MNLLREKYKLLPVITTLISAVVLLGLMVLPLLIDISNELKRVLIAIMLLAGVILLSSVLFAVLIILMDFRNRKCFEEIKKHLSKEKFVPIMLKYDAILLKEPNKAYKDLISNNFKYFVILEKDNKLLIKIQDENKIKYFDIGDNYILFYDNFNFI